MERLWAPWRMEYIRNTILADDTECIFKIGDDISKDAEKLVLYRGKTAFVMMNKYPYNNGHLLIAPFRHIGEFCALTDDELLEMQELLALCIQALKRAMNPQGFNIGLNLGRVAGAGVEDHIHYHIVPRWNGDTNFMPVFGQVKVISEGLDKSYIRIKDNIEKIVSNQVSK